MRDAYRKIMLVIPIAVGYFGEVLHGFASYAIQGKSWEFDFYRGVKKAVPAINKSLPDGIVLHIGKREVIEPIRALNLPYVLISDELEVDDPRVGLDEEAIGRMAADHLLERGFNQLGFCGYDNINYSNGRETGFCRQVKESGKQVCVFNCHNEAVGSEHVERQMERWLREFSRPVGIVACHDLLGMHLVQRCRHVGLRVPEDIAVLGIDNCLLECEFTHPPLSSVDPGAHRVGYEAARLLDHMMDGEPKPIKPVLVEPLGVVTRQSTDILAIDDPVIADALRFIREHAGDPVSVDDVLAQVPVSRRKLERQFKTVLGRSPLAEIRRMHIERAKQLLSCTDWSLEQVAAGSGMNDAMRLCHVFRKNTGMTPRDFRKQCRAGSIGI